MPEASEVVLDRLAKLLNFAANTTGPEAETAAQRAAEIMAKYQVDAAEVEAYSGSKQEKIEVDSGRIDAEESDPPQRAHNTWKTMLSSAIVINLGGKSWISWKSVGGKKVHTIMMVGPQGTVRAARYLYMALSKQLERMVRQFLKETGGKGPQGNAYLQGAVGRIYERMKSAREAAMKTASSVALTVIDKTAAAVQENLPSGLKDARPVATAQDMSARMAGYHDAGKLDLGDPDRKRLEDADEQLPERT